MSTNSVLFSDGDTNFIDRIAGTDARTENGYEATPTVDDIYAALARQTADQIATCWQEYDDLNWISPYGSESLDTQS